MRVFRDKVEDIVPVGKKSHMLCRNGLVKQLYTLRNKRKSIWDTMDIPYIKEADHYLRQRRGRIHNRLLLVTEDINVAMKTTAYMKFHAFVFEEDAEDLYDYYDYEFEGEEEENADEMIQLIDFNSKELDDKGMPNKYIFFLQEINENSTVVFTGLDNEIDMQEKLEVLGACPAANMCIVVSPEHMMKPWVQELLIDMNCGILTLSPLKQSYYEAVLANLLEGASYKLAKELSAKKFIHMIRKRRGKQFREEDIAWYLDKALEKIVANGHKSTIIQETDLPELFAGQQSPMECLGAMTGLANLKQAAVEVAAITKEEMANEKLGVLHKNMIFVGNPGTGKTTGAKLLADIMAEEGNTNAKFVTAERKSLIGQYVGHTAPKVAKMFEEARGGVLFVDEAGFFLNESSGGFVEEAMKEFIRYMEVYPDVTVIFAMYSDEVKRFLELDSGLSSRVSRFVQFEDYTTEELCEITVQMLKEKGYLAGEYTTEAIKECIEQIRTDKQKKFGNAREARTLAESVIITASMRQYDAKKRANIITPQDVKAAYDRLHTEFEKKQVFGFGNPSENNKKICYGY